MDRQLNGRDNLTGLDLPPDTHKFASLENVSQGRPACPPISSSNSRSPTSPRWNPTGQRSAPRSSNMAAASSPGPAPPNSSKAGQSPNASLSWSSPTVPHSSAGTSPEYQKILPGRLDNSTARAFVVEGVG